MNKFCIRILITTAVATLTLPAAFAQNQQTPAAGAESKVPEKISSAAAALTDDTALKALSHEEIYGLTRLAGLPQEKLTALRQSVERLEKMTPEERKTLRQKLENLRNAGSREIEEANKQRRTNFLVRYWNSLPPEKKKSEEANFQKMSPEERRAYVIEVRAKLRANPPPMPPSGFPPPPPKPAMPESDKR